MAKVMAVLFEHNPLMNWDDVEMVFALAHQRNPDSSFAASRKNMRGLKFKKFTMRDEPDGSQIVEALVEDAPSIQPAEGRPRRPRVRR